MISELPRSWSPPDRFLGFENLNQLPTTLTLKTGFIKLDDDTFDIIICTNSFHHYLHPDKALNEMYRLTKKGGEIYLLDPTADNWLTKAADRIIRFMEPEHVKLYSTKEFQQLFENARFRYVASETIKASSKVHIAEK